jgi:hypothetical protein
MSYQDNGYDQTERIRLGWGSKLALWAIAALLCLLFASCAAGPIHRALDKEIGVICYYTATAMSCLPVRVKKRGHQTDEASTQNGNDPSQNRNAGNAGK